MVTRANLRLMLMKKQGSECVRIISLLQKIFGKQSKVFYKFADTANKFIKLFSLYNKFIKLFSLYLIYLCVCTCMF